MYTFIYIYDIYIYIYMISIYIYIYMCVIYVCIHATQNCAPLFTMIEHDSPSNTYVFFLVVSCCIHIKIIYMYIYIDIKIIYAGGAKIARVVMLICELSCLGWCGAGL